MCIVKLKKGAKDLNLRILIDIFLIVGLSRHIVGILVIDMVNIRIMLNFIIRIKKNILKIS